MAPKGRSRPGRGARQQRSSQLGELDTTPTGRHSPSPPTKVTAQSVAANRPSGSVRPSQRSEEFENDLNDDDLLILESLAGKAPQDTQDRSRVWSEADSQTRRSSPAEGEMPKNVWDFENGDDSLPQMSSPKSGLDKLPDTNPLPPEFAVDAHQPQSADRRPRIDLSETASTLRRSSPFEADQIRENIWDLAGASPLSQFSSVPLAREHNQTQVDPMPPPTSALNQPRGSGHDTKVDREAQDASLAPKVPCFNAVRELRDSFDDSLAMQSPVDDRQVSLTEHDGSVPARLDLESEKDFVPSPEASHSDAMGQSSSCHRLQMESPHSHEVHQDSDLFSISQAPLKALDQKGKKRKQRAKTPMSFDENTQEVKEGRQPKKKTVRVRMPIVAALSDSVHASSSPAVPAKRSSRKTPQNARKKRKAAPRKTAKEPETRNKENVSSTINQPPMLKEKGEKARHQPEPEESRNQDYGLKDKTELRAESPSRTRSVLKENSNEDYTVSPTQLQCDPLRETLGPREDEPLERLPDQPVANLIVLQSDPGSNSDGQTADPSPSNASSLPQEVDKNEVLQSSANTTLLRHVPEQEEFELYEPLTKWEANKDALTGHTRKGNGTFPEPMQQPVGQTKTITRTPVTSGRETLYVSENDKCNDPEPSQRPVHRGRQPQRESQINRTLSISERGSPVRLQRSPTGDLLSPNLPANLDIDESTRSPEHRNTHCDVQFGRQNSRKLLFTDSRPVTRGKRLSMVEPFQDMRHHLSKNVPAYHSSSAEMHEHIEPARHAPSAFRVSGIRGRIQAQMVSSLQEQQPGAGRFPEQSESHEHRGTATQGSESSSSYTYGSDISKQLHGVIDIMTKNLNDAGDKVHNVVDAYKHGTSGCVERIERRFNREHDTLMKQWDEDGKKFSQSVGKASGVIRRRSERQRRSMLELQQSSRDRGMLYDRAIDSLRSLHDRLLNEQFRRKNEG